MLRQEPVWVSVVNLVTGSKGPSGTEARTTTPPKGASDLAKHAASASGAHRSGGQRHHSTRKLPMAAEASHGGDLGHLLCTPSSSGSRPSDVNSLRVYESPAALSSSERRSSARGAANVALEGLDRVPVRTSTSGSEADAGAQTAFERKLAAAGSGQLGLPVTSGTSLLASLETESVLKNTAGVVTHLNDASRRTQRRNSSSCDAADGEPGAIDTAASSANGVSLDAAHASRKPEVSRIGEGKNAASLRPDTSASIMAPYQSQQLASSDGPQSNFHDKQTSHQALSRGGEPPHLSASEEQSDCALKPSAPAIGEKDDAVIGPGDVATSESHREQPSPSVALDGLPLTTAEVTGEEHWETGAVVAAGIALPPSNRGSVATSAPGELAGEGGSSPEPSHPEYERGLHHKQLEKAEEHVTATDSLTGVLATNASAPEGSSGEQLRGTGCSALADNLSSDDQMGGSPSPMAAEGASQLRQQEAGLGPLSDGLQGGEASILASRNVAELEQASLEEVEDLECLKGMEVDHQEAERVVMPDEASDSGMMTSVEDLVVLKMAEATLTPPGAVGLPAAVISSRRSSEPELSDPDAELAEEPVPACHHPPSTIEDVANGNGIPGRSVREADFTGETPGASSEAQESDVAVRAESLHSSSSFSLLQPDALASVRDVGAVDSVSPRPSRDSSTGWSGSFIPPRSHPLHGVPGGRNQKAAGERVRTSEPPPASQETGGTTKVSETEASIWTGEPTYGPDDARGLHVGLPKWERGADAERPYTPDEPRFGSLLPQKVGHLSSTPSSASEALSEAADALGRVAWLGEDEMRSRSQTESSTPRSQKALVAGEEDGEADALPSLSHGKGRRQRKRRGIMDWDDQVRDEQRRGPTPDFTMSPWMGRLITEAEARAQEAEGRSPREPGGPPSTEPPSSPSSQPSTVGAWSSATGGYAFYSGLQAEPLRPAEPGLAERQYYATYINHRLSEDSELGARLPLPIGDRERLVAACSDGILLCKLLNSVWPEAVDERALNRVQQPDTELSTSHSLENNTLFLKAAGAVGCSMPSVTPEDLTDGKECAVMECIWQVIKGKLLKDIKVATVPELVVLRLPDEEAASLLNVSPEQLLRRWVNLHLAKAGSLWHRGPVDNLSLDLLDSHAYDCLLHQLAPDCGINLHGVEGLLERAEIVVEGAKALTSEPLPPPTAIAEADERLNLALLATLFNAQHGLAGLSEDIYGQLDQFAQWLESYKITETREERTFCVWMSTFLEAGDAAITNLSESLKDGYLLLRVLDQLAPGCVSWRKAHKPPFKPLLRRPASIENCNQVMSLTRNLLKLPLVNIGPEDILNGDKKLTGALLWQLMRFHIRSLLQAVSKQGTAIDDKDLDREILAWANSRVAAEARSGLPAREITSFNDASIASGLFLLDLLAAIDPSCINPEAVTAGATEEEREMNARYIISIARKLGADIFLLWEDIVEVKPKMILVFLACLQLCDSRRRRPSSRGGHA